MSVLEQLKTSTSNRTAPRSQGRPVGSKNLPKADLSLPDHLRHHPKRLLTLRQTAEFVGKSRAEVRRLIKLGQFPKPKKLGGYNLSFSLGELIDYLDLIEAT